MADGSSKPIEDVQVGDEVLAADPETGESGARPVVDLIRHGGDHLMVAITLEDGTVIEATDGHPFWDATAGGFVDAVDLQPGDRVLGADGHEHAVASTIIYVEDLTAYNLEIDGIHTYYAGKTPVLVHNSCSDIDDLANSGRALDPSDAGGQLSIAGRAYAKAKEVFGPTQGGPRAINEAGQLALEEILTNPGTVRGVMQQGNFAGGSLFLSPGGIGAVFSRSGVFQYFGWM